MRYLNIGCGRKFNKDSVWENIDMISYDRKHVRKHNLLKGLPYQDSSFDALYHSQVLEHFQKEKAKRFVTECYRVLKKGGLIRIVVPDLENIASEYLRLLNENLENSTVESKQNYDWIVMELFDQAVRNKTGGSTKEFFTNQETFGNRYLESRTGGFGLKKARKLRNETSSQKIKRVSREIGKINFLRISIGIIKQKALNFFLGEKYRVGSFRLGGEIHYWMYDRFSLSELLKEVGFKDVKVKTAYTSDILNWEKYELDVKDNKLYDPTSLFMEARK